jgi:hypothetical protein
MLKKEKMLAAKRKMQVKNLGWKKEIQDAATG